ncbi:unnamed protein product [Pleuronectes platessa]|uniref:Uncharacterized protein n=1 Tax=Pleuronectes platessa TaxID=8262 RepID=A0A9N7UBV4_PLEPL|nr:unnamed protein product [Pleuronectes platessa]
MGGGSGLLCLRNTVALRIRVPPTFHPGPQLPTTAHGARPAPAHRGPAPHAICLLEPQCEGLEEARVALNHFESEEARNPGPDTTHYHNTSQPRRLFSVGAIWHLSCRSCRWDHLWADEMSVMRMYRS